MTKVIKKRDALDEIAYQIVSEHKTQNALFGEGGIFKELQKRILEAALNGELTDHLGYKKHEPVVGSNSRNGFSKKTLQTSSGEFEIEIPRDRESQFEPQIVPKHQKRFDELDDKILALYARGMSTQDISDEMYTMYRVDVSDSLISEVTEAVIDDVKAWQSRPLDSCYPILYLDCLVVKVRQDKQIINKSIYLALGVNTEGQKELLGMWISQSEGAKFWLGVLTEIKNRGVEKIFLACVDGLTGFPEAIEAVYPKAKVQLCIVHMVRNSLKYVSWKDRKILVADLRKIYTAKTLDEAETALTTFSERWDEKYPSISQSWLRNWDRLTPFFSYPADIRKAIYTTNAIESMNMTLRKVIKNKRVFPNDDAVFKLIYLAINNISKRWTMPIRDWKSAMARFMIEFSEELVA